MPSIRLEDLTPFARVALKLDRELTELARLGDQISGTEIESDNGLDEGIRILNRVSQCGQIAETMKEFSTSLQEARGKAEAATKLVAERAQLIQQRRQAQDQLQQRLTAIKEKVKAVGASLAGFGEPVKGDLSQEDKRRIAAELAGLQAPMSGFIETIQAIKAEAARSNFKRLERQADSMIDSLQASRRKIAQVLADQEH